MGGHQSRTRKLTLENEDPGSVIKVSDEVVERLKGSKGIVITSKHFAIHFLQKSIKILFLNEFFLTFYVLY